MFVESCKILGVERAEWQICAFQDPPRHLVGPFDLVTAWQITFNNHNSGSLWGPEEWADFLQRMRRLCSPQARIVLSFNTERESGAPMSQRLRAYFINLGARVHGNLVYVTANQVAKSPRVSVRDG